MPGFLETFPFIEDIRAEKLILKTCPLEGLVMLKLLSNNSKPDRTHDLIDIDNIIDAYFDWYADEIYTTHSELFEIYDVEDLHYYMPMVAAHLIGRKMNNILKANTDLKNRIIGIVEKKENPRLKAIYNALRE